MLSGGFCCLEPEFVALGGSFCPQEADLWLLEANSASGKQIHGLCINRFHRKKCKSTLSIEYTVLKIERIHG